MKVTGGRLAEDTTIERLSLGSGRSEPTLGFLGKTYSDMIPNLRSNETTVSRTADETGIDVPRVKEYGIVSLK